MLFICKFGRSRSRTSNIWLHCSNWLLSEPFVKNPKSSQTIVNLISSNIDEFNCFDWNLHYKSACIWAKEWRQSKKKFIKETKTKFCIWTIKTRQRPLSLLCSFCIRVILFFFYKPVIRQASDKVWPDMQPVWSGQMEARIICISVHF